MVIPESGFSALIVVPDSGAFKSAGSISARPVSMFITSASPVRIAVSFDSTTEPFAYSM